ncbi:MAG: efflux RND transporter periplasmic adaptor subunit [Thermoanaerobaculales bacterium]|jgi:HlyD family secretion protein|nr:efflux RND transporter periplasmic adaptor subunit [Thermoanaerobaculales bacterium]
MKKPLIITGVVAVLAVVVWASLRDGTPKGTLVNVQEAQRKTVSARVKATGEITPEKKVEISAKVVGEIISLPVVEGQRVSSGDLLVEIERDLYEAARDQARAALRQAEVSKRRLAIQLEDARRNLQRVRQLYGDQLVSDEALDQAQLAVDTAEVEIQAQEHAIAQYRSALKRANDDLARTTIRSPMDGVLIQLDAEQGETVVPGSTNLPGSVIMTVADMSRLLAEVEVSEVDVVNVALGQEAEVTVEALADAEPQVGRVVEIATSGRKNPSQGTIRFRVKIALDDPHPALRPAMTAKVDILTATSVDALTVPVQAVVTRTLDAEGSEVEGAAAAGLDEVDVVYTIADGKSAIRAVETGVADVLDVEITDGLDEGEEVIIGPYRSLKKLADGDAVRTDVKTKDDNADNDSGSVEVRID